MGTPQVHAELIKAWADGATIEVYHAGTCRWLYTSNPCWETEKQYRIKPNPDITLTTFIKPSFGGLYCFDEGNKKYHNLQVTFDGETHKIKKVKMLE